MGLITMPDSLDLDNQSFNMENVLALLRPKMREKARVILTKGGADSVRLLTSVVSRERSRRRLRTKGAILAGSLLVAGSVAAAVAHSEVLKKTVSGTGLSGLLLLAFAALTWFPTRLEQTALEALLQSEDPANIGTLMESLHLRSAAIRAQAKENLVRLLPQMTSEIFDALTPVQRGYLYGTLKQISHNNALDLCSSVLAALGEAGDKRCLSVVYQLASGDAEANNAEVIREAARRCIDLLFTRLDFGAVENLPHHILKICGQMRTEKPDFQVYAVSLLALRQLLPQLTPDNYKRILSANHRHELYLLLMLHAASGSGVYRYGRRELHLEIIRTAERMGDTHVIDAVYTFACTRMAAADETLYAAVNRTLKRLETLAEREEASKSLLRGGA